MTDKVLAEADTIITHLCHDEGCRARYDDLGNHRDAEYDWEIPWNDPRCDCGMAEQLAPYYAAKGAGPLAEVMAERARQDEKWGPDRDLDDLLWLAILSEEVGETAKAIIEPEDVWAELVQVAAVALAWLECMERRDARLREMGLEVAA